MKTETKLSFSAIGKLTGLHRNTISDILTRRGVPIHHKGTAKTVEVGLAIRALLDDARSAATATGEEPDLNRERALWAAEQRRKLQRENDAADGIDRPMLCAKQAEAAMHEFGARWHGISNVAANAATGKILRFVEDGIPGGAQEIIAMGVRDGLVSACALLCSELPKPLIAGLIAGLEDGGHSPEIYDVRTIIGLRAREIERITMESFGSS